jgi:hypothetical protein
VKVPIACTLSPGDARSQLGEWRELLPRVTNRSERVTPIRLELTIKPDADIGPLIDLAQREVACCAFFSFCIEIQADRLVLAIEVPEDAVEILDGIVTTFTVENGC